MGMQRFKVTIPDLTRNEAIELLEHVGGGSIKYCDENGKGADPKMPFTKLFAYPRTNKATIETT